MSWKEAVNLLPPTVRAVLEKVVTVANPKKVILFGSRARGNHRVNSDFDIAVSKVNCSAEDWLKLISTIDEEPLSLHPIDLMLLEELSSDYQKEIELEGVVIYEANT